MHFQTFRRRVRNEEFVNSSASTLSFRDSYSSSPELLKGKCFLESAPRRNEACVYANTAQSVISSTKEFAIFRWNTNKRQTDRRRREEERGKKGERERIRKRQTTSKTHYAKSGYYRGCKRATQIRQARLVLTLRHRSDESSIPPVVTKDRTRKRYGGGRETQSVESGKALRCRRETGRRDVKNGRRKMESREGIRIPEESADSFSVQQPTDQSQFPRSVSRLREHSVEIITLMASGLEKAVGYIGRCPPLLAFGSSSRNRKQKLASFSKPPPLSC